MTPWGFRGTLGDCFLVGPESGVEGLEVDCASWTNGVRKDEREDDNATAVAQPSDARDDAWQVTRLEDEWDLNALKGYSFPRRVPPRGILEAGTRWEYSLDTL